MDQHSSVRPDAFLKNCPSRDLFARLSEKWALLSIAALAEGPLRFGALRRQLEGVTQKMLTQTLRKLESDGLIKRQVFDEMPLRVEYSLTERGWDLMPLVKKLKAWAERNFTPSSTV
jgi:DNA-binding HxlR family transcriptional regulator